LFQAASRKRKPASSASKSSKPDPLDPLFKALANSDRRAILDLLRDEPRTTGDLCKRLGWLDRCTVMLHLRTLENAGLVIVRREGRLRWNHLDHEPIRRAWRRWIREFAEPAADLLVKLKAGLEHKR
jgi:DNA-binding transcriptional ArsR family regulator